MKRLFVLSIAFLCVVNISLAQEKSSEEVVKDFLEFGKKLELSYDQTYDILLINIVKYVAAPAAKNGYDSRLWTVSIFEDDGELKIHYNNEDEYLSLFAKKFSEEDLQSAKLEKNTWRVRTFHAVETDGEISALGDMSQDLVMSEDMLKDLKEVALAE